MKIDSTTTLVHVLYTYNGTQHFRADIEGMKNAASSSTPHDMIAAGYVASGSNDTPDKGISAEVSLYSGKGRVYMHDSAYTTDTALEAALSGVYLVYPLLNPTTETADPYTEVQVCSPYGTEEYVDAGVAAGTRDVAIPCGHNTEYMKNIVGAIEGIPLPPTTNGNFKLRCTVASGVPTYSWVSE